MRGSIRDISSAMAFLTGRYAARVTSVKRKGKEREDEVVGQRRGPVGDRIVRDPLGQLLEENPRWHVQQGHRDPR